MSTPHKHAALIKAWADGAEIQIWMDAEMWINDKVPIWDIRDRYRIKPEPKPNTVKYGLVSSDKTCIYIMDDLPNNNDIKVVFDGETKKLKSVEMI